MAENFASRAGDLGAPARGGFAVTANDSTDLVRETRAIHVGQSGDLAVVLVDGSAVVLAGLVAGSIVPVRAMRVKATGTTAGLLVGLY
jgi:hypothetical protein